MKPETHFISWKRIVVLAAASALFGFLAYVALINHFAYESTLTRLNNEPFAIVRYGTVISTDPKDSTVTIQTPNPFTADSETQTLAIAVTADTIVAQQSLVQGTDGSYGALSTQTSATFADILPGTHIRVHMFGSIGQMASAQEIVLGDPL